MRHFFIIICSLLLRYASLAQNIEVIIALDSECPMSQKYARPLRQLQKDFPNVHFKAIFTPWETDSTIQAFFETYHFRFDYIIDREYKILDAHKIQVVPEVIVTQAQGVIYQGAIDDWYYELGKYRTAPTIFYLRQALEESTAGKCVSVPYTKALGCIIEYD